MNDSDRVCEGSIEVLSGTMFGGKTKELIRRLIEAETHGKRVQAFKHKMDGRYHFSQLTSHDGFAYRAEAVRTSAELLSLVYSDTNVVGIDEGQFFDPELPSIVTTMADRGIRVVIATLDLDYLRRSFGCAPELLALATTVVKCRATCAECNRRGVSRLADFSRRTVHATGTNVVGGAESYEPLCRACYLNANDETVLNTNPPLASSPPASA